ncbi:MAG: Crp/Fnr family transcriptional regulator [Deltaproteobacteria bacterium]|nr:Crp/Fnr family transcriptional regulator [Deltaproteobacteria bacterium]
MSTRGTRPGREDVMWWRARLRQLTPFGDHELLSLERRMRVVRLAPGEALLHAGDRAEDVALLQSGVLRELFTLADGTERTRSFSLPGDFAGSLSDLLRGGPSRTSVVAEVPSRLLVVPWDVVLEGIEREPLRTIVAQVTRQLYIAKSEREVELLALDAEARYARFQERFGAVEELLLQRHVASYLGVTPEHLSRVRSRLAIASAPTKPARKKTTRTRASGASSAGPAAQMTAPSTGSGIARESAKRRSNRSRRGSPSPTKRRPA